MSVDRDQFMPSEHERPVPSWFIDCAAIVVTFALLALIAFGIVGPIRGVLALLFVMFVPGWAVVTNWRAIAQISRIAVSVLFSVSICAAAATISLWLHLWTPIALFLIIASASVVAIVISLLRRRAAG